MLRSVLDNTRENSPRLGVALQSPAKLNLSLVIRHQRPDGFHELHTVMAFISLTDDLVICRSSRRGIHLKCHGLNAPCARGGVAGASGDFGRGGTDATRATPGRRSASKL